MRERRFITAALTLTCILQGISAQSSISDITCTPIDSSDSRGVITSPNYPRYEANSTCIIWYISGQHEDDVVTISFVDYDIPILPHSRGSCSEDNELIIGSVPKKKICGTIGTSPTSYSYEIGLHKLWIQYRTSQSANLPPGRGFKLEYLRGPSNVNECLEDETQCYESKNCILDKWKCNGASECSDGSDEIGCGKVTPATPPANYSCGEGFGCESASDGQYRCFPQRFICDGTPQCVDGKDEHKCERSGDACAFDFHSVPFGSFTSPNYPNYYPENTKCTYKVRVDQGKRVQLRFPEFRLGKGESLYIYDGSSTSNSVLDELGYNSSPPKVLTASGDTVFIEFRSNQDGNVGHGFNISYQIKGYCFPPQFSCKYGDDDCYDQAQHCDGVWDCPIHGGDERGCGTCSDDLFSCRSSSHCYEEKDHCNGLHFCPDKSDEEHCTDLHCNHGNGTFLCHNKRCIYESWVCDRADDCKDNSDEKDCSKTPSRKVVTAAVLGSLLCALLLVVAIGFTCQLHARRMNQMLGGYARYMSPMSRVEQEIWARQSAPPLYDEAMRTSRPFEEAQRDFMQALQQAIEQRSANEGNNASQTPSNGIAPTSTGSENPNQNNNARPESVALEDEQLLDLGQSDDCILNATLTTEEEEDASNVLISINTGAKAQWRRSRSKTRLGISIADEGPSTGSGDDVTPLQIMNSCDTTEIRRHSPGGHLQSDTNIDIDPNISDTTTNNTSTDKPIDLPETDSIPIQIINKTPKQNEENRGETGSLGGIDDLDEDEDGESVSQNSASSSFIAHNQFPADAGRLLAGESFGNRPLDGASVAGSSDVSFADWPENGGCALMNNESGDGDISMLSLD